MRRLLAWVILGAGIPIVAFLLVGWIFGLVILAVWLVRLALEFIRLRKALQPHARCPAGHRVAQHGRFLCDCGALYRGWVWKCPVCRREAGYTPCPTCGLAVTSPLER